MTNVTTKSDSFEPATDTAAHLFDNWFDPIEIGVRERVREFIEALIRGELDAVLHAHGMGGPRMMTPVRQASLAIVTAAAPAR